MMSIDMGGPFNKAGYLFGTAALASGNYEVMASVMVGGMVPPIAIALSTTFFPKKWTLDERRNGVLNYVMGLCFVTEGAIPMQPLTRCTLSPAAPLVQPPPVPFPWRSTAACAPPRRHLRVPRCHQRPDVLRCFGRWQAFWAG